MLMPKIFIIIVNWNQADLTIECLKSLGELRIKNYELGVTIVDNGSTDNSTKRIKNQELRIKLLETGENLGFAGGNNVGITYALESGADYVCLLNNDTVVDPNLVEGLLETFKEYPKAGAISPKIYFAKGFEFHKNKYKDSERGKVLWYAGGDMDWNNVYGSNHGVDEVDKGQFNQIKETDFATGCCVMIPGNVLREVGLLNEKYYLYMEDVELCQRILTANYQLLYTPLGHLWHKVSQSSGIGSQLNDYFITRNRLLFGIKYASVRTKFALMRESIRLWSSGRPWQKVGVMDFYLRRLGKGSWK
jgi:GT2 family glycosyltransferase